MITIEVSGRTIRVNQTNLRANPDPWRDVDIPGLEGSRRGALRTCAITHQSMGACLLEQVLWQSGSRHGKLGVTS
eukprot:6329696-Prorocentrum_lima.AAC.1